jgi:SAM-dependent methyltransferase
MAATPALVVNSQNGKVVYLSSPLPVNMGDWWFEVATLDHFWVQRRFDVLRRLAEPALRNAKQLAEVGCGNGLLQRQIEDHYGLSIAGFELNEVALQNNLARISPLYCYDIHQRNPEFRARFDLLFLFDVLEHIDNEARFLQSIKFHLASEGVLLINVPAHQALYSDYDRAAGHVRRYSAKQLTTVAEQNGFKVRAITFWGLPLLPLLLIRKTMSLERSNGKVGFDLGSAAMNAVLALLSRWESIPQKRFGTSVMAVLENC